MQLDTNTMSTSALCTAPSVVVRFFLFTLVPRTLLECAVALCWAAAVVEEAGAGETGAVMPIMALSSSKREVAVTAVTTLSSVIEVSSSIPPSTTASSVVSTFAASASFSDICRRKERV
jgi:hypothetical protein